MKVFVRAKVWAAINTLRGQQTAPGRTPLQAAEERVEAAKQALNRCEQALAEAEGLRLDAQRLTILIGTYCPRCLHSHGFCSVDVTTVAVSVPRASRYSRVRYLRPVPRQEVRRPQPHSHRELAH